MWSIQYLQESTLGQLELEDVCDEVPHQQLKDHRAGGEHSSLRVYGTDLSCGYAAMVWFGGQVSSYAIMDAS